MKFHESGKDDQGRFKITGLYGVPFSDEEGGLDGRRHGASGMFRKMVERLDAITYLYELGNGGGLRYVSPQVAVLGAAALGWAANPDRHPDLIHPDDRAEALAKINLSLATGKPMCHDYRLLTADGRYAWYRHEMRLSDDMHDATFTMQGTLTDITLHKQTEQQLLAARQQLSDLALTQDEVKARERQRIAQDIHDELGGLLTCINAYIGVYLERNRHGDGTPDALLTDASDMAREAISSVRQIVTALRPSALDALGLWAAIEKTLDKHSGLTAYCDIDPALEALVLGADVEVALYRIVQEALTNVTRHAAATQVSLRARRSPAGLRLTISDNGRGMPTACSSERKAWGILGMQERAARLNGMLSLVPAAGGGTELVLELPLEVADAE